MLSDSVRVPEAGAVIVDIRKSPKRTDYYTALLSSERRSQQIPNRISDRLHRNRHHIVDQAHFLLDEWFSVGDSAHHAVEAGHGLDARANFFLRGKYVAAGFLIAELRFVGHQRRETSFKLIADVHNESRSDVAV